MFKWCCCSCGRKTYEPEDVQELDFRHKSLSEVPPEVFTYERTLERLFLSSNQITDLPPNLFHCHELRELDLCDNELGEIPAAIESLTKLSKLNCSRNSLAEIPESIKNCKHLVYLDLGLNRLAKIPESICQLVHLEELFLNETALEFLPANLGRLSKLKVLELRDNALVSLPMSMTRLNQLQRLDMGCNEMEELPTVVGSMTNLVELWSDDNVLRGDGNTRVLGNLTKLVCLDVSKNEISTLSEQIGKCTNLTDITFSFNEIPELPSTFTKLENLTVVRFDHNRLTRLPEDIGRMKNLQELSLSTNLLRELPLSIGLLRKLHTLYLDDNRLLGLPKEIGSCTSLTVLSVANNGLPNIPSEIGHLSNLKVLVLTNNSIRFLPVSILGLNKLGALWLTEGQNKPMVTLTREYDSITSQHICTCCLLPQLPSPARNQPGQPAPPVAPTQSPIPPRSARKIRFENESSPSEPASPEKPVANGGGALLRAPTPYPKELRAMAKHVSHIRNSKNLNGDAVHATDEPVYEGDAKEDGASEAPTNNQTFELKSLNERLQEEEKKTGESYHHPPEEKNSTSFTSSAMHQYPAANHSQSGITTTTTTTSQAAYAYPNTRNGTTSQQQSSDMEPPAPVASSLASRTPPPYHIAAQRAAFFRSSGGAGTGKINFPSGEAAAARGSNNVPVETTGSQHPTPTDSPPITPDYSANTTNFYEPNMCTPLPQSSNSSSTPNAAAPPPPPPNANNVHRGGGEGNEAVYSNVNHHQHEGSYEPAAVNDLYLQQLQMQSDAQSNHTETVEGADVNDNSSNSAFHSDRNGNITSNKPYSQQYEPETTETYREETGSREEVMPPPMPLLIDNKEQQQYHQQHQPHHPKQHYSTPTLHNAETSHIPKLGGNQPKVSRIPGAGGGGGKRHFSTSHVSNVATPSRIPGAGAAPMHDANPDYGRPSPSTGIPQFRNANTVVTNQTPEYQPTKAASTSRIPGGLPTSKRNAVAMGASGIRYAGGGGASGASSATSIPRMNSGIPQPPQNEVPKSYSRIPKPGDAGAPLPPLSEDIRSSSSQDEEKRSVSAYSSSGASERSFSRGISPKLSRSGLGRDSDHGGESKIPRKPWIFGTHRNARVVSVEHRKTSQFKLGFTVVEYSGQPSHPEGKGIYVSTTDAEELPVKVGDKILQVDGIDVGDMGVDIVNKILSNCQENIQLLVSRQH